MMTRKQMRIVSLLALVMLGTAAPLYAQSGGYNIDWWTVDGGGVTGHMGTGGYTLGGTAGQPDAASWQGDHGYSLSGGFWHTGAATAGQRIFLPLVVRGFET